MKHSVYSYIFVMAAVTYLIRLLPLTLIRKEIKNPFIKSFLYYVPYVCHDSPGYPGGDRKSLVGSGGVHRRADYGLSEKKPRHGGAGFLYQRFPDRMVHGGIIVPI
jgi:hypothetical protein